ncbi:hypothetical protein OG978_28875 [Streptomyces sp. NBC_01591]|uniref:hypothetical protein n=1 Tax=Streptomyces sp. NBC_01591 TaxID=2975888 RepID=UPI002DD98E18|nr:hypothetical protein [Streptomyces sp. NBC_01591]WSD71048.1 hypothetical protein OG978_28875 [Streptomyces sp. NBC_01591]
MAYRFWCGECGFKTPWLAESEGAQRQLEHYTKQHPGILAGGHVETNRKNPQGSLGCLQVAGILVLLLIIAAACQR